MLSTYEEVLNFIVPELEYFTKTDEMQLSGGSVSEAYRHLKLCATDITIRKVRGHCIHNDIKVGLSCPEEPAGGEDDAFSMAKLVFGVSFHVI